MHTSAMDLRVDGLLGPAERIRDAGLPVNRHYGDDSAVEQQRRRR